MTPPDDPTPPEGPGTSRWGEAYRRLITTKHGQRINLRPAGTNVRPALGRMYDHYEPKHKAQGLPPADADERIEWIRRFLAQPVNAVAEAGPAIVGHGCLIDMEPGVQSELFIIIHQDWQNQGVGTALLGLLIDMARHVGYREIWLAVDVLNTRAIHVYHKCGFCQIGPMDVEIEMTLRV